MTGYCDDFEDNDCDGVSDCSDPDCFGQPECSGGYEMDCVNGMDDDMDG